MQNLAAIAWAELATLIDLQLSPLGQRAIEALSPQPGESILDIGCGTGQTVLQLAELVGPHGRVVGVDIAPPVLVVARRRAAHLSQASFAEGDATSLDLPSGTFDAIFSRFGIMAFRDPVAAFGNFRRMLTPGGRLAFVCWRSLEENELDALPLKAAGHQHLMDATPFSFADRSGIQSTLLAAGFQEIVTTAYDKKVSSGSIDAMITVLLRVGPLGKILRERPDLRDDAEPRVRAALAGHHQGGAVALRAATWIVTARR